MNINTQLKWFLPIVLLLLISPFTPQLDLVISNYFYQPEIGTRGYFENSFITNWLYRFGLLPAWIISVAAGGFVCLSHFMGYCKKLRAPALCLIVDFIVGPGIITNLLLKNFWGRPRPIQIDLFGGAQEFRPFYSPHFHEHAAYFKSFPSGHCTMGFFFFALCLIANRLGNRTFFIASVLFTSVLGLLLTYARIAQGGHFFSDTLWAAGIMWYITIGIDWLVYEYLMTKKRAYFS